jgi:hypothetical protein
MPANDVAEITKSVLSKLRKKLIKYVIERVLYGKCSITEVVSERVTTVKAAGGKLWTVNKVGIFETSEEEVKREFDDLPPT